MTSEASARKHGLARVALHILTRTSGVGSGCRASFSVPLGLCIGLWASSQSEGQREGDLGAGSVGTVFLEAVCHGALPGFEVPNTCLMAQGVTRFWKIMWDWKSLHDCLENKTSLVYSALGSPGHGFSHFRKLG